MKRRFLAIAWASLVSVSAGCMLQQSSGGLAAGGSPTGGDGHDGAAPDGYEEGPDTGNDLPADAGDDGELDVDSAAGDGGGGGGDADAASGDGGGGDGGGAATHCSALPFGCVCSPTEPSQVGACNTASVVQKAGQRSICCDNPYNCICVAYECVRDGSGSCSCQLAAATAGTRVDDCGAVTTNPAIKCCRSYGQCVCSTLDCLPIETQVSGCSVTDLLTCDVGSDSVPACEPAGAAGQPSG